MTLFGFSLVSALLAADHAYGVEPEPIVAAIAYTGNTPPDALNDCETSAASIIDEETCEVAALVRDAASRGAQLIVVSESAFETESAEALPRQGRLPDPKSAPVLSSMSNLASDLEVYLAVPLHTEDYEGRPRSSLIAFGPTGRTVGIHHKVELYSTELDEFVPGERISTFATPWGRVAMMLCSDVYAAPALHMALARTGSDIVLLSSMWTVEGSTRWQSTFAHDWGVYVVAANGAGGRGKGSGVYDRDGSPIQSDDSGLDTALVSSLRSR